MKRHILLIFLLLSVSAGSAKSKAEQEQISEEITTSDNNAFSTTITNPTPFDVDIETQLIEAHTDKVIFLTMPEKGPQDGFPVKYKIELLPDISLFIENIEKKLIILENQSSVKIPALTDMIHNSNDLYVIVKNSSKETITRNNAGGPVSYLKQSDEILEDSDNLYILEGKTVVFKHNLFDDKNFFVNLVNLGDIKIPFPSTNSTNGYVYTYEYDGTNVVRTDARPIHKMKEPSWRFSFAEKTKITAITSVTSENNYYIAGNKIDSSGRSRGFIDYLNSDGSITDKPFESMDGDSLFYDLAVDSNGYVYAVGSIRLENSSETSALIAKYDDKGNFQYGRPFPEGRNILQILELDANKWIVAGLTAEGSPYYTTLLDNGASFEISSESSIIDFNGTASDLHLRADSKKLYIGVNPSTDNNENPPVLFIYDKIGNILFEKSRDISNLSMINDMCLTSDGIIFAGKPKHVSFGAQIIKLSLDDGSLSIFYTTGNSSVESICMNDGEIVFSGFQYAKDDSGIEAKPFLRAISGSEKNKELWTKVYTQRELPNSESINIARPAMEYGFVLAAAPSLLRVTSSGQLRDSVTASVKFDVEPEKTIITLKISAQIFPVEILDVKINGVKTSFTSSKQENNFTHTINSAKKEPGSTETYEIEISYSSNDEVKNVALSEEVQYAPDKEYQTSFNDKVLEDFNKIYSELESFQPFVESGILTEDRKQLNEKREFLENIYKSHDQYQYPNYIETDIYKKELMQDQRYLELEKGITELYKERCQELFFAFLNSMGSEYNISDGEIEKTHSFLTETLENFNEYDMWHDVKDEPEIKKAIKTIEDAYEKLKKQERQIKRDAFWDKWDENQKNRTGLLISPSLYFSKSLSLEHERAPFDGAEITYYGPTFSNFFWGVTLGYNDPLLVIKGLASLGVNATIPIPIHTPIFYIRPYGYIGGGGFVNLEKIYDDHRFGLILRLGGGLDIMLKEFGVTVEYSVDWYQNTGAINRVAIGLFWRLDGED